MLLRNSSAHRLAPRTSPGGTGGLPRTHRAEVVADDDAQQEGQAPGPRFVHCLGSCGPDTTISHRHNYKPWALISTYDHCPPRAITRRLSKKFHSLLSSTRRIIQTRGHSCARTPRPSCRWVAAQLGRTAFTRRRSSAQRAGVMAHVTLYGTFRRPVTKGIGFHEMCARHLLWNFTTVTHERCLLTRTWRLPSSLSFSDLQII